MSGTVNQIDATGGGAVPDGTGMNVVTAGASPVTVTASQGTDTIRGGSGALTIDASQDSGDLTVLPGSGPLDFTPGSGANSVVGADGVATIEAGLQGFEGTLAYQGGTAAATVNGYIDTTVTGGVGAGGTILFLQNGPATVVGGAGAVTVYADGNQLTVTSPDGSQSHTSFPVTHAYLQVTEGEGGLSTVTLNAIDGTAGGRVIDQAGSNWITLGPGAATVVAALGSDTVEAGAGDATVDGSGSNRPIVINAGTGTLEVIPGPGSIQVVGGAGSIRIAADASPGAAAWNWLGPAGDTVVLDHDGTGLIRVTNSRTGALYTLEPGGAVSAGGAGSGDTGTGGIGTGSAGASAAAALLAGEAGTSLFGAMTQRLDDLLGVSGRPTSFAPGQPVPQGANVVPELEIAAGAGSELTVPAPVGLVINQLAGADLQGNGQANQFITSSQGFTYHANGGSGVILADDAQAGGLGGNNHIVLAPSGGGAFLVSTGSGDDTIEASSGNDTIAPGAGSNLVFLGAGSDVVDLAGADTVVSGAGAATVSAVAGPSSLVFGGSGTLSFAGGAGAATVVSGDGQADLTAASGDAVFWGSRNGDTTMHAGTGAATLVGGGAGNVIYAGGPGDELLVAGIGNSTLLGGSATGSNIYWGSRGDDFIQTDSGHDTVIAGPGYDTIQAGSGDVLIFGGPGGADFIAGARADYTEIISGGGAANTFSFVDGQAGGSALIWGFRAGIDHLSLEGYGANELAGAVAGARGYGDGTALALSDGTSIIFGDLRSPTVAGLA